MHHLGLALGGRPGQSFARRFVIPVSKDPCCGWSGAAAPRRPASPRWLASMTGLGSGAIVMGQSSAIWNNGGSSTSSLIGRWQLLPSGLPSTPPSPSSPATAGLGLYRRPPRGRPEAVQVGRYQPDPAVQREGRLRPAGRARPPRGQREWPFVRIEELYPLPAIPFLDIFPRTPDAPCVWVQQEPHNMAFRPGSTVSWRTCGARRVARHGW